MSHFSTEEEKCINWASWGSFFCVNNPRLSAPLQILQTLCLLPLKLGRQTTLPLWGSQVGHVSVVSLSWAVRLTFSWTWRKNSFSTSEFSLKSWSIPLRAFHVHLIQKTCLLICILRRAKSWCWNFKRNDLIGVLLQLEVWGHSVRHVRCAILCRKAECCSSGWENLLIFKVSVCHLNAWNQAEIISNFSGSFPFPGCGLWWMSSWRV